VFLVPTNRAGILASRALLRSALATASPPVRGSTFDRVEQAGSTGGIVRGEWVRAPAATREDGVILYIHGSAYVLCSSRTHRGITSHLSAATQLPVFSIDYRLSPTHRYPAASHDVREAWDWLLAGGYDPARIVIAGDSAGGQLAISLAIELARAGDALPAALVTLSPLIDLSLRSATVRDRIERDPFAPAVVARRMLERYADADARQDPGLRIEFDDMNDFPPTLVHAGSKEMLAADCTELARRIRGAGFLVAHRSWPGQMHVFHALTAVMPESREALHEIGIFIKAHLPAAVVQTQPRQSHPGLAASA
jgi:acetyl esterase/lipase